MGISLVKRYTGPVGESTWVSPPKLLSYLSSDNHPNTTCDRISLGLFLSGARKLSPTDVDPDTSNLER